MDLAGYGIWCLVFGFTLFMFFANPIAPMNYIIGLFFGAGIAIAGVEINHRGNKHVVICFDKQGRAK